jgi:hypothetical protein
LYLVRAADLGYCHLSLMSAIAADQRGHFGYYRRCRLLSLMSADVFDVSCYRRCRLLPLIGAVMPSSISDVGVLSQM